ncbi:MAG TPA: glycosyltransferase [Acidimicrobiia bacterium]
MTEREDELWEYIRSLQNQIDRLVDTDEKRRSRIDKLEEDRRILRERLERARRRWRLRRSAPAATTEPRSRTGPPSPSLEVPGVGVIGESEIRDGAPRRDLKVATVLDPISATVFGPEFHHYPVSARSWQADIEEARPDLLFVESAYRGHDGNWATRVARFGAPSHHLADLVAWCRTHDIPTVFWNKEDPINFDWFVESARLFDFVFTVDGDMIPRYREVLGHDRVQLLQFFAQPAIHYPGPEEQRKGAVAFAGSYFAFKHPERREQMEMLLDPAREFGLHIFDRHGDTDDERFRWPEKYRPHIMGSLTYLQTVEAYRRYKVFVNVNTVTNSPTMCARRVFELAACGTPILSGPARALAGVSEDGVVEVVSDQESTSRSLNRMLSDVELRHRTDRTGRRWIDSGHTAAARVEKIVSLVGG